MDGRFIREFTGFFINNPSLTSFLSVNSMATHLIILRMFFLDYCQIILYYRGKSTDKHQQFLGLPPVFYLLLNKAIRRDVKSFGKKICEHINKYIHPSAVAHLQSPAVYLQEKSIIASVCHQECAQNSVTLTKALRNQIVPQQAF